jgi:hypothetical protein
MVTLSPKQMFQASDDNVKLFGTMAHSSTMQIALALALTQFSISDNPTAEEMSGAKKFIQRFLNMGERDETPTVTPYKSIATVVPPRTTDKPPEHKK